MKMMSPRDRIFYKPFLSISMVILLLGGIYLISLDKTRQIKKYMVMSDGYVFESKMAHKGGVNIFYRFNNNNQIVYGTKRLSISSNLRTLFINRNYLVVFSSKNSDNNEILILPEDYKKYGIPFPDSLKWIPEKIK